MIPTIIIIISIILDGILSNFLPYTIGNLSYFTPLLTLVSLFLIYSFYIKETKKYYTTVIIMGLIYDLLYTNLLFYNSILFFIIAILIKHLYKNFEVNYFNIIIYTIVIITSYETIQALIILSLQLVPITIPKLIYKITHSLILNIIYTEIIYFIIQKLPKKYKKININ